MTWWYKLMFNYHEKKLSKSLHPDKNTAYQYHIKKLKYLSRKLGYKKYTNFVK